MPPRPSRPRRRSRMLRTPPPGVIDRAEDRRRTRLGGEPVRRNVQHGRAGEPRRLDRLEFGRGSPVREHRPLAIGGIDDDDDRSGPTAAVGSDLDAPVEVNASTSQRPVASSPTRPMNRVGANLAALAATFAALPPRKPGHDGGIVGAPPHRPVGPHDDVLDQVADHGQRARPYCLIRRSRRASSRSERRSASSVRSSRWPRITSAPPSIWTSSRPTTDRSSRCATCSASTIVQGEGSGTATLDVDERHINPHGTVHGGVMFVMLDTAMGAATMSVVGDGNWSRDPRHPHPLPEPVLRWSPGRDGDGSQGGTPRRPPRRRCGG